MPNTPGWIGPARPRTRRRFLRDVTVTGVTLGTAFHVVPGLFAQTLRETARMTEGPFYPDRLPLDTDNDLLIINDALTPAVGEITHLTGRILTASGDPVRNAFVEIWQVDHEASYLHTGGRQEQFDANFQGYGRFLSDSTGRYYFRTIKPVPYTLNNTFRAPHIHMALSRGGRRILTTQLHVRGHADNERDPLLRQIRDSQDVETVLADFAPLPGSRIGELSATFDLVVGATLQELEDTSPTGGLARPERMGGRGGRGGAGGPGRGGN
jgi:protocatechuate 3,4-dioxygenase, beta subunit